MDTGSIDNVWDGLLQQRRRAQGVYLFRRPYRRGAVHVAFKPHYNEIVAIYYSSGYLDIKNYLDCNIVSLQTDIQDSFLSGQVHFKHFEKGLQKAAKYWKNAGKQA